MFDIVIFVFFKETHTILSYISTSIPEWVTGKNHWWTELINRKNYTRFGPGERLPAVPCKAIISHKEKKRILPNLNRDARIIKQSRWRAFVRIGSIEKSLLFPPYIVPMCVCCLAFIRYYYDDYFYIFVTVCAGIDLRAYMNGTVLPRLSRRHSN